jgi:hypothetical protein
MRKLVLFILLLAFLAILATCSMSEVDNTNTTTPTVKMVNAIVAQTEQATFTSTPKPTSTPTPTATPTLKPVNAMVAGTGEATVTATATPTEGANPLVPESYAEFTDLKTLQEQAAFAIWTPSFVPEELPFLKGWLAEFTDGSQEAALLYSEPGDPLDAHLKGLQIHITKTSQPITRESISQRLKSNPQDLLDVTVRGQPGFTYREPSTAAGNMACLEWRKGGFNFSITLSGDWPQPDESTPHGLDPLLIQVAEGLQQQP